MPSVSILPRTYPLLDPYAGIYNMDYVHFLVVRVQMFRDDWALLAFRENVWMNEGRLEFRRRWEAKEHHRKLVKRMTERKVIFSTDPNDYLPMINRAQFTPKFLNKLSITQTNPEEVMNIFLRNVL